MTNPHRNPYQPPANKGAASNQSSTLLPEDERWLNAEVGCWRKRLVALGITLLCLHGPFSWLLTISYPWDSYRMTWLMLWPILPGLWAGLPFHPRAFVEFPMMALATLALVGSLTYISTKGAVGRIASALIGLAISVPTAMLAYSLFRA